MPRSSKSTDPSIPPRSFEAALEELESTVERMEAGELSLEQSLAAHKRGLVLVQYCQSALSQARQQVQVLEGDVLKTFGAATAGDDDQDEGDEDEGNDADDDDQAAIYGGRG